MLFENNANQTSYKNFFFPTVTIKDYNIMIDGKIFFDQSVKNNRKKYDNIKQSVTGQRDD